MRGAVAYFHSAAIGVIHSLSFHLPPSSFTPPERRKEGGEEKGDVESRVAEGGPEEPSERG